jgi:hypothetical protein
MASRVRDTCLLPFKITVGFLSSGFEAITHKRRNRECIDTSIDCNNHENMRFGGKYLLHLMTCPPALLDDGRELLELAF